MVKIIRQNKELYQCEECGFKYADSPVLLVTGEEWAKKCERWCKKNKSCNLEIVSHAIKN